MLRALCAFSPLEQKAHNQFEQYQAIGPWLSSNMAAIVVFCAVCKSDQLWCLCCKGNCLKTDA
eukprot:6206481-Pleurochrysis_carterae.AAC.1